MLVIFGPKKSRAHGQLAAWILGLQFKILLEVRNCFRRVVPEGRGGTHSIVVIWVLWFELHGLFKRISRLGDKA